jgi:hypothetical protein
MLYQVTPASNPWIIDNTAVVHWAAVHGFGGPSQAIREFQMACQGRPFAFQIVYSGDEVVGRVVAPGGQQLSPGGTAPRYLVMFMVDQDTHAFLETSGALGEQKPAQPNGNQPNEPAPEPPREAPRNRLEGL